MLSVARRDLIAFVKTQLLVEGLVAVVGAIVGLLLLSEPVGILVGVIATLALVVLIVGAWCVAWAPVNISRSSHAENQGLQAEVSSLQSLLNEGKNRVSVAIQELRDSGHFDSFRNFGKGFIQGTFTLWSGFNQDGIRDLLMMKLINGERIPNPPKPETPLEPGAFRIAHAEPPFHTLYVFTDLGEDVWKKIQDGEGSTLNPTPASL